MAKRRVRALSVAALIAGALTACGGGGGPAATPPAPSTTTTPSQTGLSVGGSIVRFVEQWPSSATKIQKFKLIELLARPQPLDASSEAADE